MKKVISLLLVFVLIFTLAACGDGPKKPDDAKQESSKGSESAGGKLIVYSNSLAEGRSEWLKEEASKAGFSLDFVDAGGGDILNRLLAEKNAPLADVVYGLDETMFLNLKKENLLIKYTPKWADKVDASLGEGFFAPLVEQRIIMVYNPEYIKETEAPKDWVDLATNPAFVGKYRVMPNTGGGTNQKALISMLLQYKDANGEQGISDEGWKIVKAFVDNGYRPSENEDAWVKFKNGEMPINYWFSSGIPGVEEKYEVKANVINPSYGVVTMTEQIGVINKGDGKDYKTAQDFVDWFGSSEIQGAWAEKFGSIPVNKDAAEKMQPRMKEIKEATTSMDIDWSFVDENLANWLEKMELDVFK